MRRENRGLGWVLMACFSAACAAESPPGVGGDAATDAGALQADASATANTSSSLSASTSSEPTSSALASGMISGSMGSGSATAVETQAVLDASAPDGSVSTAASILASSTSAPSVSSALPVIDLDAGVEDAADGMASEGDAQPDADAASFEAGPGTVEASAPSATAPDASASTDAALADSGVETIANCPAEWTCDPAWQIELPAETIVDLATAADGSVYLLGVTGGDVFVRKLDADLQPVWTQLIDSSGNDSAASIAVDAAGDIYAAGNATASFDGGGVRSGAFVRKLNPAGNTVWTFQFLTSEAATASNLAVTPLGEVYVAGVTTGTLQTAAYTSDAFVRKLDADGLPLWVYQVNYSNASAMLSLESSTGVTADEAGVTLAGRYTDNNDAHNDAFLHQLDAEGSVVWTQEFTSTAGITIDDVASDAAGNLYLASTHRSYYFMGTMVTTSAAVRKLDSLGNQLWFRWIDTGTPLPPAPPGFPANMPRDSADAIAADALGNVMFAGHSSGSVTESFTFAFDNAGDERSSTILPEATSTAVAVAANGDALTVGTVAGYSYLLRTPIQ
jgi:hypothetical protein